ncbi:MAG TPA: glycoside hydrolase family 3 N-terminal domain-containing protein, partial [Acidimicrobiales bacterium]|nr:glycoside hydrolase family 3 N-terminal domain-containing protein [Acidimicrobiales bacterium]
TWDPDLIEEMGRAIGEQMRSVGVHQGLAPVLDVVRDARWGRVEECIGEDPYLVGTIASAYVRGLERAGVIATLKHFAGYSSSEGGRNLAPAHVGPRQMEDVFLVPFEMGVCEGGARSVMNAYQDNDGLPAAASHALLTDVLRERWGFDGIVVSDYFAVNFLHALHGVAEDKADAAQQALDAGIDVELPNPDCYPALEESDALDRAVLRVLRMKRDLGLLDNACVEVADDIDLDPPTARALARRVAERSIVLLKNDGVLPLSPNVRTIALIGPNAMTGPSLLGNYTFQNHVAAHFPDADPGAPIVTIADGLRAALPADATIDVVEGCSVLGDDRRGFAAAVDAATRADVAIVVVGDQAGHFGAGTSGEGTDTDDLSLPGVQEDLVHAVIASGTPTVVVLVTGRPYAIPRIAEAAPVLVATWFPGEEGGHAVAAVLTGAVEPSGRTPLTFGRGAGQQPLFYNDKPLGHTGYARSTTRPVFPFGHGLSYTTFAYTDLEVAPAEIPTDGTVRIACTVTNTGTRPGDEVVQLYLRDPVASVTRPVLELVGFARAALAPAQSARVEFAVHADRLSFTGRDLRRVVEPGTVEVQVGASCQDVRLRGAFAVVGELRDVPEGRILTTPAIVNFLEAQA